MTTRRHVFPSLLVCVGLAACGGGGSGGSGGSGGGGGGGLSISFSTSDVTFAPASVWDAKPADQTVTATLHGSASGTVYIAVVVNNPELASVPQVVITGGRTGQATIVPVEPNTLGAGNHDGTITVVACRDDPTCTTGRISGTPKTINIHYNIPSNVEGDVVMPGVVEAGSSGRIVLRGRNFTPSAAVSIGTTAGSVTYVSSTELRVDHPALTPGKYALSINSGAIPFGASLDVVPQTDFSATFLPHPVATPATNFSLEYDARRQAILVGVWTSGAPKGKLIRHAYSGGSWASPTSVDIDAPRQTLLTADGSKLLALRNSQLSAVMIDELDPVTLATIASTTGPSMADERWASLALANDGHVLVAIDPAYEAPYLYSVGTRKLTRLPFLSRPYGVFASDDGSRAMFMESSSTLLYDPSNGMLHPRYTEFVGGVVGSMSSNLDGSRILAGMGILDGQTLKAIGHLGVQPPSNQPQPLVAVMNRAGTRAYSVDSSNLLHTFDLTQAPVWSSINQYYYFPETGTGTPLFADPGFYSQPLPQITLTPDGRTVILLGYLGVLVQPVPQ